MKKIFYSLLLLNFIFSSNVNAQLVVDNTMTPAQLAQLISGPGVIISNPTVNCDVTGYGRYNATSTNLNITEGILLTTGSINNAIGPNNSTKKTTYFGNANTPSPYPLLDNYTGRSTYEFCEFQFDIVPQGDTLKFDFVFASEEYEEWVGSQYNDVFGFFISGPGITGDPGASGAKNIALIPNTTTPVTINNVNQNTNTAYYQNNNNGTTVQYDGFTKNLKAISAVQPCQSYHLKLVVADASDKLYDSGVFVEKISSNNVLVLSSTAGNLPHMVEGCNFGTVTFKRAVAKPTPLTITYYIGGTATNGVDYPAIGNVNNAVPKTIVIPANQTSASVNVQPYADNIVEIPREYMTIYLGNPFCSNQIMDSLRFYIQDSLFADVVPRIDTLCSGASLQLTGSGGTAFSWTPSTGLSATNIFNPVASPTTSTTYVMTTSASTCNESKSVNIRVSNINISFASVNVSCFGANNGSVTTTVTGAFPPVTYSWTGPNGFTSTQQNLTNLAPGTYTLTVNGRRGCSKTATVTITEPAVLAATVSSPLLNGFNVGCYGANTGTATAAPTGGTTPYTYSWNTSPVQTGATASGLIAGTYNVVITDAKGCTVTKTITLTQPPIYTASISAQTNVLCRGNNTGAATAAVTGGVSPYTYSWNSSPVQTTVTATGLTAGTYIVTVRDNNACNATATVIITQPAAILSGTIGSQVNVLCRGNSTGTATVSPAGGTSPYTYSWNSAPVQTTVTAINLPAGNYVATITDNNACTTTVPVTISQPASNLSASTSSQTNVLCRGIATGSATVNPSGGTPGYTYSWNTTPVQTAATANNLAAGTYTCNITDANLCTFSVLVTITQPATVLSSSISSQTNVLCFGAATGAATASGSGGVSPYTYSWNTTPVQTTVTATALTAGTYTVTVKDVNNCTSTSNVTITQPAAVLASSISAQTNVLCRGNATGAATVTASGGAGTYTYSWNTTPVQTTATATGLVAGTYTVTVKDASNCTSTSNVTITQPAAVLTSSILTQTNVLCFGGATGSATGAGAGGVSPYTYSWNTTPIQTNSTATLLGAGTYIVTVKDANNCTSTSSVTITQPAAALASSISTQTNVLCFGNATGSATATATGGAGTYTYSWNTSPVQTAATATGLSAGTYIVTVKDANNCSTTSSVTITQPSSVLSSSISSQTNVLCRGNATGAATATATGGAGTYTYSWNTTPIQTTATATGLVAGTYTVTVKDANNCTSTSNVTITQPATVLSSSISAQTNVLCFGSATASATVTAAGGAGSYTYSWNTTPVQTGATATGLTAGTYIVTVKDANNCSTTSSVTITQPVAVLASSISAQTNVLCFGNATGSATVTATGGAGTYTYSWNTTPVQTTATATGLIAGTYIVTVKDANNCSTTSSVTITQPVANVSSSISSQTNVLCRGNATGVATVTAAGGTSPYTYSWNTTPVQTTATATGLVAGTYTVTVKDVNNCSTTSTVIITQPVAVLASSITTQTNVLCRGNATGSATVTATGGAGSFTYSWNTAPVQTGSTATGLIAGTYTVTITDANGCTTTSTATITQPAAVVSSSISAQTNVLCKGNATGSATVLAVGGVSPYTYSWNTSPVQTTGTATGLVAGTYIITVTDANGCSTTSSAIITQPATIVSSSISSQTNVLCRGNATGSATALAGGGVSPYTYSWNSAPVQTTATATGLVAGTYIVTVKDVNNCSTTSSVTITQPAAVLAGSISAQTNVLCRGNATGTATVTVTGGVSSYTYSWNTAPVQTGSTATGLVAGTYTATITDANGCTTTATATITQPAAVVSSSISTQTNVLCRGNSTGSATVLAAGGVSPYTYSWNTSPVQTTATATGLVAGTYTVTVKDINNCSVTSSATITEPSTVVSSSIGSQTNVLCRGNATGAATVLAGGGVSPYTYSWNSAPVQTTATATGLVAGTYIVTVKDVNNCSTTSSVTITQPAAVLAGSISAQTNVLCRGNATGTATVTVTGGVSSYTYSWNTAPVQTGSTATGLVAGTYTVTVTDANGCTTTATATITQPAAVVSSSISAQTNVLCRGNSTGSATVLAAGGVSPYTYSWNTAPVQTTVTATGLVAGTYTVTVTDANGCLTISSATITQPATNVSSSISAQTNVACFGTATGSATVLAAGGVSPYTYSWNSAPVQTTATAIGLVAGTYIVTVKDVNNCSTTSSVTITQPTATLAVTIPTKTNVLCRGNATGVANAVATGGSGSYTYSWNSAPVQTTASATGLVAGTYTITITDNNGCATPVTATTTITQPAAVLSGTTTASNFNGSSLSCYQNASGTINLVPAGGTSPYTYAWTGPSAYTSTSQNISGLTAGTYNVTITDANGCTNIKTVTLTEPAAIALTNTMTPAACNSTNNGAIDLTIVGGTPAYTYAWTGPLAFTATTQDISSLAAGTYQVTVTDLNSCSQVKVITVTQPGLLNISQTLSSYYGGTNVKCYGATNGSIGITVAGGTLPYTYAWTGPSGYTSTIEDIATLASGSYQLVVTDANNCSVNTLITLTQPQQVTAALTPAIFAGGYNITCNGTSTGSITNVASGGTAGYTYSWTGPSSYTSSVKNITGLAAGTYNVAITDTNGCTGTASVTLTQPTVLTSSVVSPTVVGGYNVTCNGASTGSVDLTVAGGTSIYTYAWTGPSGYTATTQDLSSLAAGTYSVLITDAHGCTNNKSITLTQPTVITSSLASPTVAGGYNITCNGASNGAVNLTVSGGQTPYTYAWTGTSGYTNTTQNISALPVGTYTVLITDANGCTSTKTITITQPAVLTSTVVSPTVVGGYNITCNGASTGSVDLTVAGGTSAYTYAWTGPSGYTATTQDLNAIAAGTYSVTITDANGCTTTKSITLTQPAVLTSTVVSPTVVGGYNITCNGSSNGSVDLTVTGGQTPYTYAWTGPSGYTNTTQDISALPAGTYSVNITDANGCTSSKTITLTQPIAISSSLASPTVIGGYNITCNGASNGAVNLTISGGQTPYTYAWTGTNGYTNTTQNISSLPVGTYTVLITDANGCTSTKTKTITQPAALTSTVVSPTVVGGYNITCNGASNGSVDLTVAGGQTPYTYAWTGPSGYTTTTQDLSAIAAGTYSVTITDANGCTATKSITLTQPAVLTSSVVSPTVVGGYNITCNGASNGSVDLTVTGGQTPYTYAWAGPSGYTNTTQDISSLPAGTYSVNITDANGCTSSKTITLTQPTVISSSLASPTVVGGYNITCNGASNGAVNLTISGGQTPYTYAWTGTNGYTNTTQNISALPVGTYIVLITDANGCTSTKTITLTEPAAITSTVVSPTVVGGYNITCNGASNGSVDLTVAGGQTPYVYAWTGPSGYTATTQDISSLPVGTYSVLITDANGCTASKTITLTQPTLLTSTVVSPTVLGGYNVSCNGASNGSVDLTVLGGQAPYTYVWTGSNGYTNTTQDISLIPAGTYSVLVTDANGCTTAQTITLTEPPILTANAVSPTVIGGYNVTCSGAHNGSANLTVGGGQTPYTYSWTSDVSFTSATQNLSGIGAGNYFINVTDANGCVVLDTVTLTQPNNLTSTIVSPTVVGGYNITCNGASDGAVNLIAHGGQSPYTYAWTGPGSYTNTTQNISGLLVGTYTVVITDANGCSNTKSITLTEPAILSSGISSPTVVGGYNITCNGASNGIVDLTVTGGQTPYTYTWTGTNGYTNTTQNINTLPAGTYSVNIADANGCANTQTITLTEPAILDALATSATVNGGYNVSCNGTNDGNISLAVTGGQTSYNYSWTSSNGYSSASQNPSNVAAGTYYVNVTDANGCVSLDTIILTQPNVLTASTLGATVVGGYNISCNGASDGSVTLTVNGGQTPFVYSWTSTNVFTSSAQNISAVVAGTYYVNVVDANGCSTSDSIVLTQPNTISSTITNSSYAGGNNISCFGSSDGSIALNLNGGTNPFSYVWTGTNAFSSTNQNISGLVAGEYIVSVTDANGCTYLDSVTLVEPSVMSSSLTNTIYVGGYGVTCSGASNGAINSAVIGGSPAYTYLWNSNNGFTSTAQNISSLVAGTYYLSATDLNGCRVNDTLVITEPSVLSSAVNSSTYVGGFNVSCYGGSNGTAFANPIGGTTPYHYAWSGPNGYANNQDSIINLAAGTYNVAITDSNGCSVNNTITLTQPNPLNLNAVAPGVNGGNNISCYGSSNGSVALTVAGGFPTYTYQWTGTNGFTSTNEDLSNLPAGVYHVLVTDANACSDTLSISLIQPDTLTGTLNVLTYIGGVNVSCKGATDGAISISVQGGSLPYVYLWNTTSTNDSISGIGVGNYSVIVSDANNCTITQSVVIKEPSLLNLSTIPSAYIGGFGVSCNGSSDGSATSQANGGTFNYHYAWTGPNSFTSTTPDISNLSPGTYALLLTDTNGCTANSSVIITEPTVVSANNTTSQFVGGNNISCYGSNTGTIAALGVGGNAGYQYNWTSSNGYTSNSNNIDSLIAGTYNLTVTDTNNCVYNTTVTLIQPDSLLTADSLSTFLAGFNISCNAYNTGSIYTVVRGGIAPYQYAWTGPGQFADSVSQISNLYAGTYNLTITDANGCAISASHTLVQPNAIDDSLSAKLYNGNFNISCNGMSDGELYLLITGGANPFSHVWTGPNGYSATSDSITGLVAGNYHILITDANGCQKLDSITVVQPQILTNSLVPAQYVNGTNIKCKGDNSGAIATIINGGAPNYQYTWTGPNGFVSSNDTVLGLYAGTYHLTVVDANGCSVTDSVTLTEPATVLQGSIAATVYPSGSNISCKGLNNGAIDLTFAGGTPGYVIHWRGPNGYNAYTEDIDSLVPGTYDVVVTDSNSCTVAFVQVILEPTDSLIASITPSTFNGSNVLCSGDSSASINSVVIGGTSPYTYAWISSNGYQSSLANVTNVAASNYVLIVTDVNGCTSSDSATLIQPAVLNMSLTTSAFTGGTNVACFGGNSGSIQTTVTGGTAGYSYTWTGPNAFTSSQDSVGGLVAGTYTVVLSDTNNCTVTSSVTLTQPTAITSSTLTTPSTCADSTGTASLTVAGGTSPYVYSWSNGAQTQNINNVPSGSYIVSITDANNCVKLDTAHVNFFSTLNVNSIVKNALCFGNSDGAIDLTPLNGSAPYNYAWTNGATTEDLNHIATGSYSVVITDAIGCSDTLNFDITQNAEIVITAVSPVNNAGFNLSGFQSGDGVINTTVAGGQSPYTYTWSNGANTADQSNLAAGNYALVVTDANGCVADTIVKLTEPFALAMPNGFSPNGDGKNDTFIIHGIEVFPENTLIVYNRWGNKVYEASNYQNQWTGTNFNNESLPDGTYYVILNIPAIDKILTGYVDLRRQ